MDKPKLFISQSTIMTRAEEFKKENIRRSFLNMLDCHKDSKEIIAVEVGVYEGVNAKYMLICCDRLELYLVDSWSNVTSYTGGPVQSVEFSVLIREAARINIQPWTGNRAFFTFKNSLESAPGFANEALDYAYIDGDHTHEAALADMRTWYPKVKVGGVLGGHDVKMEEVSTALDIFLKENNIPQDKWGKDGADVGGSDWWVYK